MDINELPESTATRRMAPHTSPAGRGRTPHGSRRSTADTDRVVVSDLSRVVSRGVEHMKATSRLRPEKIEQYGDFVRESAGISDRAIEELFLNMIGS